MPMKPKTMRDTALANGGLNGREGGKTGNAAFHVRAGMSKGAVKQPSQYGKPSGAKTK